MQKQQEWDSHCPTDKESDNGNAFLDRIIWVGNVLVAHGKHHLCQGLPSGVQ